MSASITPATPAVQLEDSPVLELLESVDEAGQVIVHASLTCSAPWELVRVWPSTYLIDRDSDHRSALLHATNISLAPVWTPLVQGQTLRFTLVFEGLPKDCRHFDFAEIIPEPGGFLIENIERNNSDVYRIDLTNSGSE